MKQLNWKSMLSFALVAMIALSMSGCKSKKPVETGDTGSTTSTGTGDGSGDIDQDSLLFGPSGLQVIYFDYDSSGIRADQIATLEKNAALINQTSNVYIQIAGNCDERGTQEYNLALGERRALAVRDYLIKLGVPANRLVTISYGEENPVDSSSNEAAWAKNRRAEFNKATR